MSDAIDTSSYWAQPYLHIVISSYFHCCYDTMLPAHPSLLQEKTTPALPIPRTQPGYNPKIYPMEPAFPMATGERDNCSSTWTIPWHLLHTSSPTTVQTGRNCPRKQKRRHKKPDSRHLTPMHCTEPLTRQELEANTTKHYERRLILINARSATNRQ